MNGFEVSLEPHTGRLAGVWVDLVNDGLASEVARVMKPGDVDQQLCAGVVDASRIVGDRAEVVRAGEESAGTRGRPHTAIREVQTRCVGVRSEHQACQGAPHRRRQTRLVQSWNMEWARLCGDKPRESGETGDFFSPDAI